MKKVDDWDNWEKNRKKEKWRWILTFVVIFVVGSVYFTYVNNIRYARTTVNEVFEITNSDYSKDFYSTVKLHLLAEDITKDKKITLSTENKSDFLTLLENTTVTGMKKQDTKDIDIRESYIIEFESNSAKSFRAVISRDENTQNIIFEISYFDDIKLAEYYIVQGEELFNKIEELIKQAP